MWKGYCKSPLVEIDPDNIVWDMRANRILRSWRPWDGQRSTSEVVTAGTSSVVGG